MLLICLKGWWLQMRSDPIPLLDNIETSYQPPKIPKSFNINAYGFDSLELLYNFDDIKSMHFYKVLSYETAISLYDFADRFTLGERAEKMLVCGNRIGYDDNNKIVFANFCRQRLCPLCQRRRSLRVFSGFCRVLEQLSDFKFLHLVLTVPNCEPEALGYTLDIMQKLSSRLFRLPPLKRAFKGIARCTEVSYNKKTDSFHPHFHCLHCQRTICLTELRIPSIVLPEGYQVDQVNYIITGICPNCAATKGTL